MPACALDDVWGDRPDHAPVHADEAAAISSRVATNSSTPELSESSKGAVAAHMDAERLERMLVAQLTAVREENERRFQMCVGGVCVITVCLLLYIDRLQLQLRYR